MDAQPLMTEPPEAPRCVAGAGPLDHKMAVMNERGGVVQFLCGLPLEPTGRCPVPGAATDRGKA